MGYHWSAHRLTNLFAAVIDADNEPAAIRAALENAAEVLDAEVGALVRSGRVVAAVGFGPDTHDLLNTHDLPDDEDASDAEDLPGAEAAPDTLDVPGTRDLPDANDLPDSLDVPGVRTSGPSATASGPSSTTSGPSATASGPSATASGPSSTTSGPTASGGVAGGGDSVLSTAGDLLVAVAHGAAVVELPGLGPMCAIAARLSRDSDDTLIVARMDEGFIADERQMLQGMAQVLGLALRGIRAVAAERALREEQQREAEQRLRLLEAMREAYHDRLTGLPNRALFLDRADEVLGASPARANDVVLLFIDLDGFKTVNDSLGHTAGDELLAAVAERIRAYTRADDAAARLGGDEFAVLLSHSTVETGVEVARRLIESIKKPFRITGRDIFIAASIGLAHSGSSPGDAAALLSNADVAMYEAKRGGTGRVEIFAEQMYRKTLERLDLAADLQHALERNEFQLVYQPLIRLRDRYPIGVEALLRWNHPVRGPVGPNRFIPVMEDSGLISDVGQWVLAESARQLRLWRAALPDLTVNVNVSARQFLDPGFVGQVAAAAAGAGLPAEAITLELTETAFMTDPDSALRQMNQLKELGAGLSIDDFGTGYSSLSYLRRFPVDEVKIDRAFVSGLGNGIEDLAIVRAIIDLGRNLRLRTVAEGIEDVAQRDLLLRLDCDLGQGYHFARPMSPADAFAFLRADLAPARAA